jgi:tight adherence protein B
LIGTFLAVFTLSYQYNKRLLDWLRFQSLGTRDYIVERLKDMFIEIAPEKVLIFQFILSVGLGALVFTLLIPHWVPGLLLGVLITFLGWKAPKPIVDYMYDRRVAKFVGQMVDGLSLMSNGLKSGLSVVQAMGLVAQEMPDPIRQEFNLVLSENKLGVPLEQAFISLSKRIRSDDVEMFVTAINILKETGGNLAETFDTIVLTIRDRIKVEKRIETMTAQGKAQGYLIMSIPPVLGLVFYNTDPESMDKVLTTPVGWAGIVLIILLEAVGLFLIKKIVNIEV